MNWKEILIILGLAVLIEATIFYLFEPRWIGGPVTFPFKQFVDLLWNLDLDWGFSLILSLILAVIFWFVVLLLGSWIVKFISRKVRQRI